MTASPRPVKTAPWFKDGELQHAVFNEYLMRWVVFSELVPYEETVELITDKYGHIEKVELQPYSEKGLMLILKRLTSVLPEKLGKMTRFLYDWERQAIIKGIEIELAAIEKWRRSGQL